MLIGTILLIAAVGVLTAILARKARREPEKKKVALWMIYRINGAVIMLVIAMFGGGVFFYQLRNFDQCHITSERSQRSYISSLLLYDTIDIVTGTPHYTHDALVPDQRSLRETLNQPLNPDACTHP